MQQNPLLKLTAHIDFHLVRPEHIEPGIDAALLEAKTRLAGIVTLSGPRNYENTIEAFETATRKLDYASRIIGHLESVATYPEFRAAFNSVQERISSFRSAIMLNPDYHRFVRDFAATDQARTLTGPRARFLEKLLDNFRCEGAELPDDKKKELTDINVKLTEITNKFSQNVLDARAAFEIVVSDSALLSGLPQSAIEAAREDAQAKGKEGFRFTLQGPSYAAVMMHMDNAGIREEMYRAAATLASAPPFDNRGLLAEILELRKRKAQILGFKDFSDYVLHDRMAKNGERASLFERDLESRVRPFFEKETEELKQFASELRGTTVSEIAPWDASYLAEKLRKARYDFDDEALRPYFPLEQTLTGMFALASRLYGIEIKPLTDLPVWDSSVRTYAVIDEDGSRLGHFYADFFPRENKRGGAWMDQFLFRIPGDPARDQHVGIIAGNFTKPLQDKPSLLLHSDVETLYHEFGHLLHGMLSKVPVESLAGATVAWDFVELPSQIMENWVWEKECLDSFARHYKTGELLPQKLFEQVYAARNFRAATMTMRQLSFGTEDLFLHREFDRARHGDPVSAARTVEQRYLPFTLLPEHSFITAFTHLFGDPVGYAAGYYSYKWAEALDADAFTRFQKEGIFNPQTGRAFKQAILERGNSAEPEVLFREFMGRDPDPEALLARVGLR